MNKKKSHESHESQEPQEPDIIEISPSQLQALKEKLDNDSRNLNEEDVSKLKALIDTISYVHDLIKEKDIEISKLRRLLFGTPTSEKSKRLLNNDDDNEKSGVSNGESVGDADSDSDSDAAVKGQSKKKGHGKNGVSVYTGAERKTISHPCLQAGSKCPECPAGRLFKIKSPAVLLRIKGQAPIAATIYELERLRCSSCGAIFKAPVPQEAGDERYDKSSCAMVCLLKYGNGFAFNRFEKFQQNMGVPLPATNQWEMVESVVPVGELIYEEFLNLAAQGEVIHNDDTDVHILSVEQALKKGEINDGRTGTFTTGIISKVDGREIALYISGRKHAGENLEELLRRRLKSLGPPIQMCDAKSGNPPKDKEVKTIVANCLTHGRRKFVELIDTFPDECKTVINYLAKVYKIDKYARNQKLTPGARLELHKSKSKEVMNQLKEWLDLQFTEKKVEPNSSLGGAIKYMKKHWEKLTRFLSVENAPLDNNVVEQSLKRAILNRKNAYFFKTENGAHIGDIFMSIIQTCYKARINVFDYLVKLQMHAKAVEEKTTEWLPWNYESTMKKLALHFQQE
jgi:hypothetical protein